MTLSILKEWDMFNLFDYLIYIDCDEDSAYYQLAKRHVESVIVQNIEESIFRL